MKKIIALLSVSFFLFSACAEKKQQDGNADHISTDLVNNPATASGEVKNDHLPKFEFDESNFDFGTMKSGDVGTHEFKFKNIGDADLLISEAKGSCGCTVPEYPKEPIKPGDEAIIKVSFHSEGMAGQIAKTITILANTIPNTKVLSISAEVLKK